MIIKNTMPQTRFRIGVMELIPVAGCGLRCDFMEVGFMLFGLTVLLLQNLTAAKT